MSDISTGGSLVPVDSDRFALKSRYSIRRHKTTIGRAANCDVHIADASVSRLHAELSWSDSGLTLTPLSHTSTTYLNGVPVVEPVVVTSGDLIEMGDGIGLHVHVFEAADSATVPSTDTQRRLLTVLSADVVGYSRLMEDDEAQTQQVLESIHTIFRTETNSRAGRVMQLVGDSVLALYSSVTSGLKCALAIQRAIADVNEALPQHRCMYFRMGLHTGDVYIKTGGMVYGDAVNIAARLESLGEPGRIVVSGVVHDQVETVPGFRFELIGPQSFKNISRQINAYWADAD